MRVVLIFLMAIVPFMRLPAFTTSTLSDAPRVVLLEGFLSEAECDHMIKEARPQLQRSRVLASSGEVLDDRRTSQGMFFPQYPSDPILQAVQERLASLTGVSLENGEGIQVLWYREGGEYRPHYDYFDCSIPGGCDRGGQRTTTVIMYLHTTEEGGETIFPNPHIKVKPVKGNAVLFYNCLPNGKEDPLSLHGGSPVVKGEKWIATKWFRKGKFR